MRLGARGAPPGVVGSCGAGPRRNQLLMAQMIKILVGRTERGKNECKGKYQAALPSRALAARGNSKQLPITSFHSVSLTSLDLAWRHNFYGSHAFNNLQATLVPPTCLLPCKGLFNLLFPKVKSCRIWQILYADWQSPPRRSDRVFLIPAWR